MRSKLKPVILVLLTFVLLQGFSAGVFAADDDLVLKVDNIAAEFICNCGCNQMLNACEMECAKQMKAFIADKIREGHAKPQIMEFLKENFGSLVLAAPEKKGFGWVAYITPYIAIGVACVLILLMARSWMASRGKGGSADDASKIEENDVKFRDEESEYEKRLKDELKEFGW